MEKVEGGDKQNPREIIKAFARSTEAVLDNSQADLSWIDNLSDEDANKLLEVYLETIKIANKQ